MPSKLNETYSKYLRERLRLKAELAQVETKIAGLREAGAIEQKVDTGNEETSVSTTTDNGTEPTLTERTFQIVNALLPGDKRRRAQIRGLLQANGYIPNSENFDVTLFKTLMRLRKQGRILGAKNEGVWYFQPNREGNTLDFA